MKNLKLGTTILFGAILAAFGSAQVVHAPSPIRHDHMDARAARRDIQRLKEDRARAVEFKNWSKVAQDDRLIRSDQFWIQRDKHRIKNSGD